MPTNRQWIDFKALRKGLSFGEVLKSYNVAIKLRRGNRHVGYCPLPTHQGNKRSPSFSAKLDIGVWQCFGCKASGNVLDFAVRMEGGDPQNPQDLRATALKLQEKFKIDCSRSTSPPERTSQKKPVADQVSVPSGATAKPDVLINVPLNFELKDLDPGHPYLIERGFLPETIAHFGLGYCNRGLMKGRIAIPLHDSCGRLIGYAGRITNDAAIDEHTPKYLLPGVRERDGVRLEFHKSLFLYGEYELQHPVNHVVIVEGFPSQWWLWQWGYIHTFALMGSSCSEEQARNIVHTTTPEGRVFIFTDADPAGEACAMSILKQVSLHRFCRWVSPGKGQPTDCTPGDLERLLWKV